MNQGQLKKEFKKRDVQRMRNLITGKTGDRTQVSAGYEKNEEDHKEGDVWEDRGRTWTIKNGIKQTVSKMGKLKRLAVMPIACPNCKKGMKANHLNKKMYAIHGKCFDCVIEMEQEIKRLGKWEEYEKSQVNANKNSSLADFENAVDSWYKEKDQFFTESGEMENWSQGDKKKAYEEIKEKIEELKNLKL
jgi:hypothetical protein